MCPIPPVVFDHVCMDIFAMPQVQWDGEDYDTMVLYVDRRSGWIVAKPTRKIGLTAEKTAHLIIDQSWGELGIPSLITSDQGAHFTGQF